MSRPMKYDRCTLWFCEEPHYGRGYCARHYQNLLRWGSPLPRQGEDLRRALTSLEELKKVAAHLAYNFTMSWCVCKMCGAVGRNPESVIHEDGCPVTLMDIIVRETTNLPNFDHTFDLNYVCSYDNGANPNQD